MGAPVPGRITISLLGPVRICAGPAELVPSARKDAALLAFLATRLGEPQPRDRLADLLWGEDGERQSRDSLKHALLRVRRLFSAHDAAALVVNRHAAHFDPDRIMVDAACLEAALSDGELDRVEAALACVRGEPLDGLSVDEPAFNAWAMAEKARLGDLVLGAALDLMRGASNTGNRDLATTAARRALLADPLNEEALRFLMGQLAARGERRKAMELYIGLRDRLGEQLGVDPELETTDLFLSLRRQRSPSAPVAADRPPQTAPEPDAETMAPAGGATSILVQPFRNIGDDLVQDFLAEGLTEDIATDIARVPGLTVVHESPQGFLRNHPEPLAALRSLGATHMLTGSVRRDQDRVRISARLIEADSGRQIWANRYDRPMTGVFDLQDELAQEVVSALKLTLLAPGDKAQFWRGTKNVEAYELFLKARSFHMRGADGYSLRVARTLYARAMERDPGYALAHAQLAICMSHLSMSLDGAEDASYEECIALSRQALHLDGSLAEAHAALGLALYASGRYDEAEAALAEAMRLDPHLFEAVFFQARNRRLQGDRAGAAALFERAANLRPGDYRSVGLLAEELQALGREKDALQAMARCLERLEQEIEAHPGNADALAFGAAVLAALGRAEQARTWAEWALLLGENQRLVHYNVARTWLKLGREDLALGQLDLAFDCPATIRRRLSLWLANDRDFDAVRDRPRFRRLLDIARQE